MLAAANAAIKAQISPQESFERGLGEYYKGVLFELAKNETHFVYVHIPSKDFEDEKKFWDLKEYKYHKIVQSDYEKAKQLIAEYEDYVFADNEEGAKLRMETMMTAYSYLADKFLHMSSEDFYQADWEYLKDVLNACLYRTEKSIILDNPHITELFFFDVSKNITEQEGEYLKMYRLWKRWNTKPWEINGNKVYPEDINSILRLDDVIIAAEKQERKKEEARARMKSRK